MGHGKIKNDPIKIDNMQPEVFKIFLRLLYGGKLEFDENFATIALHLLSLSSKYGIKDLGKSIVDCMEYNLSADTAIDALRCADIYHQEYVDMKRAVLTYIKEHQKEILVSEGYKALFADPVNNMKLLAEIIQFNAGIEMSVDGASIGGDSSSSSSSSKKRNRSCP